MKRRVSKSNSKLVRAWAGYRDQVKRLRENTRWVAADFIHPWLGMFRLHRNWRLTKL